jgi:hypothetical protein
MNGRQPVKARKWYALALGNRDERRIAKVSHGQGHIRQIEMGMDDIEILGHFGD